MTIYEEIANAGGDAKIPSNTKRAGAADNARNVMMRHDQFIKAMLDGTNDVMNDVAVLEAHRVAMDATLSAYAITSTSPRQEVGEVDRTRTNAIKRGMKSLARLDAHIVTVKAAHAKRAKAAKARKAKAAKTTPKA